MNSVYIKSNNKNPEVIFDRSTGIFEISGMSVCHNGSKFYEYITQWFSEYIDDPSEKTVFKFKYTYFNTATSVYILKIILLLHKLFLSRKEVKIKWYYLADNIMSKEMGNDFKDLFDIDFELIQIDEKPNLANN